MDKDMDLLLDMVRARLVSVRTSWDKAHANSQPADHLLGREVAYQDVLGMIEDIANPEPWIEGD